MAAIFRTTHPKSAVICLNQYLLKDLPDWYIDFIVLTGIPVLTCLHLAK